MDVSFDFVKNHKAFMTFKLGDLMEQNFTSSPSQYSSGQIYEGSKGIKYS